MRSVRQTGTAAELAVRRLVRSLGFGFGVRATDLPGSPDIVNRRLRWAIFVHGCFWHGHQGCRLWKLPTHNRGFWQEKFEANRARDRRKSLALERLHYAVLVVWQCDLDDVLALKARLRGFLGTRRGPIAVRERCAGPHEDLNLEQNTLSRETYEYSPSRRSIVRTLTFSWGNRCSSRYSGVGFGGNADPQAAYDSLFLRRKTPRTPESSWPEVRCADIFSGCGGLSLGALEAATALGLRFVSALAVDSDPDALEVYRRNFGCQRLIGEDIQAILGGDLGSAPAPREQELVKLVGSLDILLAGPPCQGNSDLNNHTRRRDDRNQLYERVARLAELARPTHILVENVPTAIHGVERAVQRTIQRIEQLGYAVDQGIVDLAEVGVPQTRRRHVLVASATRRIRVAEVVAAYRISAPRTVQWAIGDLLAEKRDGPFTTPSRHSPTNVDRMRYLLDNDLYDLPDRERPECHRNGHTYKSMYGRLRWDEPAQTITRGFLSPGQGRFIHPERPRTLTPHEAARLQFFPDFFDFSTVESRSSLAAMVGNAVPMKLSYVFCLEFLA